MKRKVSFTLITIASVAAVLAGCGSGGSSSYKSDANYAPAAEAAMDYAYYEEAEEAYSDDVYEYASEKVANGGESSEITDEQIASTNRKLIKTVNMSVETKEFDKLVENVERKITELGGYAESVNVSGNSYDSYSKRYASITARIPANNLNSFVSTVETQSNITNKTESAEDVTLQYSDVAAHIESLRVEQSRLNDLLADADSLETIIALEARMTEVRYELESYESRLRTMDNQVQYSTVYLNINEVKEYKPEPVTELTFGEKLAFEFKSSCENAWETIQDFVIAFVAFLPTLLVLIIILGVIGGIIFGIVKLILVVVKKNASKIKKDRPAKAVGAIKEKKASDKVVTAVALDEKPADKVDVAKQSADVNDTASNEESE